VELSTILYACQVKIGPICVKIAGLWISTFPAAVPNMGMVHFCTVAFCPTLFSINSRTCKVIHRLVAAFLHSYLHITF
jgi:hypothetical protein